MERRSSINGLMAEFDNPTSLVNATSRAYREGYREMEAYTPFPVDGLSEALGFHRTRVPLIVLLGGIAGCFGGFFLQYYISVIYWPLIVGGRPLNSWPAFIPVTFELTVLCAALAAFFGMLALNGLPRPHHPVFNVPRFGLASRDRFFLCIEAADPKFDPAETRRFLESLEAREVSDVED
jgi:Protein of unknown function (DUF3341)